MAEILQGGKRDYVNTSQFAVTNFAEDFGLNVTEELTSNKTACVLGTLIRELIRTGVINGTVA